MVVNKAWVPSRGAYSAGTSEDPINPTIGNLSHVDKALRDGAVSGTHPPRCSKTTPIWSNS